MGMEGTKAALGWRGCEECQELPEGKSHLDSLTPSAAIRNNIISNTKSMDLLGNNCETEEFCYLDLKSLVRCSGTK